MRDVVVLLAWNSCFYCWIFYFSAPRWCFVSHTTIHVLYWFAPPFLQKKKNQKSTCLNKNISMFKAPCCCVVIKRRRASLSLLSASLRLFNTLNTLAGLNLFTSSWAAGTCQTKEELSGGGREKKKTCTDTDSVWVSSNLSSHQWMTHAEVQIEGEKHLK